MTCKDCLHYKACKSMLESMGYVVDGDGIDADKRCKEFQKSEDWGVILHGYWTREFECSECGIFTLYTGNEEAAKPRYCPHCGARMDVEEGNAADRW